MQQGPTTTLAHKEVRGRQSHLTSIQHHCNSNITTCSVQCRSCLWYRCGLVEMQAAQLPQHMLHTTQPNKARDQGLQQWRLQHWPWRSQRSGSKEHSASAQSTGCSQAQRPSNTKSQTIKQTRFQCTSVINWRHHQTCANSATCPDVATTLGAQEVIAKLSLACRLAAW